MRTNFIFLGSMLTLNFIGIRLQKTTFLAFVSPDTNLSKRFRCDKKDHIVILLDSYFNFTSRKSSYYAFGYT